MKRHVILAILAIFIISVNFAYAVETEDLENILGLKLEYKYDGYCDGATLSILSGKVTGVYASPCATCPMPNKLIGTTVTQDGTPAVVFKYDPELNYLTVTRADHTWTHYYYDGSILNQGTWTECSPRAGQAVKENLPSSTTK